MDDGLAHEFDTTVPGDLGEQLVFYRDLTVEDIQPGHLLTVKATTGEVYGRGIVTANDGRTLSLIPDPLPDA